MKIAFMITPLIVEATHKYEKRFNKALVEMLAHSKRLINFL